MKVVPYKLFLQIRGDKKSKDPIGNKIKVFGKYAVVYLNDGYFAVIDSKFVSRIEQYTWCIHRGSRTKSLIYASTNLGRRQYKRMHKIILRINEDRVVDHIDGNGLNNALINLREATYKENANNKNPNKEIFHIDYGIPEWVKSGGHVALD